MHGDEQQQGELRGWWKFDEGSGASTADSSGNDHALKATGEPNWTSGPASGGAVILDGRSRWWSTERAVVRTDFSFSVAAWVRLDSAAMGGDLELPPDEFALTAVSQDGPEHSPFYLGVRLFTEQKGDGTSTRVPHWNLTMSPVDGSATGTIEWQHASASRALDSSVLDQWVLLVGAYDPAAGTARLFVPGDDDEGSAQLPDAWPAWHAEGGLQVGRALYEAHVADLWPGSIGPVRVWSGALTADDAARLHAEDTSPRG